MALAYTAPTWTNDSGTGISANQLQAISNCIEGLVQGNDKAVHNIELDGNIITLTFADGSQEIVIATELKGIASIIKTSTSGNVDTYTITYTDGTTTTFNITNGTAPTITANATADALSSDTPTVTVTKTGTDAAPVFSFAFSGLKGAQGIPGPQGPAGTGDMDTADYDPDDTVADAGGIVDYVAAEISGKADDTDLDDWTTTSTVQSDNTVTFAGLNDSYGYDLYCSDKLLGISSISKTGSGTNVSITYTVTGASSGDVCKLRILK